MWKKKKAHGPNKVQSQPFNKDKLPVCFPIPHRCAQQQWFPVSPRVPLAWLSVPLPSRADCEDWQGCENRLTMRGFIYRCFRSRGLLLIYPDWFQIGEDILIRVGRRRHVSWSRQAPTWLGGRRFPLTHPFPCALLSSATSIQLSILGPFKPAFKHQCSWKITSSIPKGFPSCF